jgi:two-component system phosphate regulon sensor histidine kinase PhoR
MNKKVIWLIIGLMGAALLGIAGMQVKWILDTLAVNEEQFDNHVFHALDEVAGKLEYRENMEVLRYVDNGFAREYYREDFLQRLASGELTLSLASGSDNERLRAMSKKELLEFPLFGGDCDCASCQASRVKMLGQMLRMNNDLNRSPVASRIPLEALDNYLREVLQNKGIRLPYHYGVYDNRRNSFVIADGRYMVEDSRQHPTLAGYQNLFNSAYRVNLFQQDMESPGMLLVFFPTRNTFLWGSVMKTLLGSVLFMGIVLFCFAYTISVIFRQKKLSEMKTDFINNMTHEFKTPIATISLAADSIASEVIIRSPEKIRRFTDIIRQENKRMNNQVEKVLQMAQIDRQEFSLKLADIDLHEVIRNAIEYINLQVEKREGTVRAELLAERFVVQGDLTHLSNIINNLLDNANKYSPDKPYITVQTRNVPSGVEVVVSDKGIGMNKEVKKHIFEKFYRVHTGNLHDVKGFGLGLSYVKAIVDAHRGTVDVRSEPGKGSSFILFLPFRQGSAGASSVRGIQATA